MLKENIWGISELASETGFLRGGETVIQNDEKGRQVRQHRRQIIGDWKDTAKSLQAASAEQGTKLIQREARREAIAIIEDAARTQAEFENVLVIWDKVESIERDRVSKQESAILDSLVEYELPERETIIPAPFAHVWWRQLLRGDFLDFIHDCPLEIHELTSSCPVHDLTSVLDGEHKEIYYYRAIRQWKPKQIAALRGQTDRNVRKVYNKMIEDLRYELFYFLYWRYKMHLPITTTQKKFVIASIETYNVAEKREVEWIRNEDDMEDSA